MRQHRPRRRTALVWGAVGVLLLALGAGPVPHSAQADAVRRARSVCEAHELKALKAENPAVEIEIPPEFDRPFPSAAGCRAHDAAWDPDAPGPNQPLPFSHQIHAGEFQMDCLYCHFGTDRSQMAGVPSVEMCMGCHAHFAAEYDQMEGIRLMKEYWEERRPIEWIQVHRLPEHVQFQHQSHVRAKVECQSCHGPVETMDKLSLTPDTQWWQWGLPTRKLEMGWCVKCHRKNEASQDCFTCHY